MALIPDWLRIKLPTAIDEAANVTLETIDYAANNLSAHARWVIYHRLPDGTTGEMIASDIALSLAIGHIDATRIPFPSFQVGFHSCSQCCYLMHGDPPACNALRSPCADLDETNDCGDWEEKFQNKSYVNLVNKIHRVGEPLADFSRSLSWEGEVEEFLLQSDPSTLLPKEKCDRLKQGYELHAPQGGRGF